MSCTGCELTLDVIYANQGSGFSTTSIPGEQVDGVCVPEPESGECMELQACNPYSQEITFTGSSDGARCEWEMAPTGTSECPGEEGQAIPPRKGFFNSSHTTKVSDQFSACKFSGSCGETAMVLTIRKKVGTPPDEELIPIAQAIVRCTACEEETVPPGE